MGAQIKSKSAPALYLLLIFLAVISMAYYVTGVIALREEFFYGARYAREPFDFRSDGQTTTGLQKDLPADSSRIGLARFRRSQPYARGW